MNSTALDKVMAFCRVDGPPTAPVCFLTIEDGGDRDPKEEDFDGYISGKDTWIPEADKKLTSFDTGIPGEIISKIMVYAFSDVHHVLGWRDYRSAHLYRQNECNVKFYPIGRHDTSTWPLWLKEKLGVSSGEYRIQCISERPNILVSRCGSYLSKGKLFVILGACDEWSYVMRRHVHGSNGTIERTESGFDFWLDDGRLLYAYYPMFAYGYRSDKKLRAFAARIRQFAEKVILERLAIVKHSKEPDVQPACVLSAGERRDYVSR